MSGKINDKINEGLHERLNIWMDNYISDKMDKLLYETWLIID